MLVLDEFFFLIIFFFNLLTYFAVQTNLQVIICLIISLRMKLMAAHILFLQNLFDINFVCFLVLKLTFFLIHMHCLKTIITSIVLLFTYKTTSMSRIILAEFVSTTSHVKFKKNRCVKNTSICSTFNQFSISIYCTVLLSILYNVLQ